jgi:hypothetical protein
LQKVLLQERRLAALRTREGARTALIQNLTGGELQDQDEIVIPSCQLCGETSFQAGICEIIGLSQLPFNTVAYVIINGTVFATCHAQAGLPIGQGLRRSIGLIRLKS